jgi:hypothetical protein
MSSLLYKHSSIHNKNSHLFRISIKLCATMMTVIVASALIVTFPKPHYVIAIFLAVMPILIWLNTKNVSMAEFTNNMSFFSMILLFMLLPFHFTVSLKFAFYRELFDFVFIIMIIVYLMIKPQSLINHYAFRVIFIWILYLLFCYVIDPEVSIYHEDVLKASEHLSRFSPKMYTLRNLLLYLPLVILMFLRGLSRKEFIILLSAIVFISPLSIIFFHHSREIYSFSEFNGILSSKGHGIAYNTYTPYVTFPFIAGLYLLFYFKNQNLKLLTSGVVLFDFSYIVYSTSRQSMLFCVIAFSSLMILQKRGQFLPFLFLIIPAYYVMTSSDILIARYFSSDTLSSGRISLIIEGLQKLTSLDEWIIGKGLSSVVHSGPHNNYVRFIQRIGIIGTIFTFLPFFYGFVKLIYDIKRYRCCKSYDQNLAWFLALALSFTLYHSNFGYPHEEVYNTPYVWLGLSLWVVTKRRIKLTRHRMIPQTDKNTFLS